MTSAPKQPFKFTSTIGRLKTDASAVSNQLKIVSSAIDTIYQQSSSQLSFNDIYGTAYNLVLQKQGDALYERIRETCETHLSNSVAKIVAAEPTNFLSTLIREWSTHNTAFESIARVLMYMDRTHCEQKKKPDSMTMMLSLFREKVIYKQDIRSSLRVHLLEQVLQERRGNMIDRSLLRETLFMLVRISVQCKVSVYEEDFEQYFLTETENFYRAETLEYITTHTCPEYMTKVTRRLAEESERLSNYLAVETEPKLRAILEQQLLTTHVRTLIDMEHSGILALYRTYQPSSSGQMNVSATLSNTTTSALEDLKRFFLLFHRVPACLEIIRDTFGLEIIRRGMEILTIQETTRDPITFVKDVLSLKDQYDDIVRIAYRQDKRFEKKIKDAFQSFINRDNRTAAHLSAYLDEFFRKHIQGLSEADINIQLDKIITIFHFLSDKDVFEEYYKNSFCKRLLNQKTISDDQEQLFISKLKTECGYQYTTKLEGMFHDMNTSKLVMEKYRESSFPPLLLPLEMDVQVLTTGFWPLQPSHPCNTTIEIQNMIQHFTEFYSELHSGRKLVWFPSISNNDIRAYFPLGKKELNVTTFQWCILACFNAQESWSYEALKEHLKLPDTELKRHLLSLCTPKLRILNKSSRGKGIEHDDVISFNATFDLKLKRFKVPLISLKEIQNLQASTNTGTSSAASGSNPNGAADSGNRHSVEGQTYTDEMGSGLTAEGIPIAVEESRRHQIEAAVVRIMKARKSLVHNELIAETTRQLSHMFTPSAQFIKKRIESLIEREFLQRDPDDTRLYNYVA